MARDSNLHILLAEDEELHRKVIMLMLSRLGYKSDVVSNGYDAIRAIKHDHYDLTLMDLAMPKIDGLQATREIRKMGQNRLKIIGVTAYVFPGIREICLKAGMDDCITKPIKIGELADVLKKYTPDIQQSTS